MPAEEKQKSVPVAEKVWEREQLLFDGDAFFESVLREIDSAQTSIDFETYIYRGDVTGQKVAAAFVRAAARGVAVRVIVDGIGASGWFERHAPLLEKQNVAVRIYHPILFFNIWSQIKIDLGFNPNREKFRGSALISRLNRRDHRKMSIIDGRVGFVGSVNVTDDHCASVVGARAWRDTSVRVEGPAIRDLINAFDDVWDLCHDAHARPRWAERIMKKQKRRFLSRLVRLNYTSRLRKRAYRQLCQRISKAKVKVWITNPYFAPSIRLIRALKRAAKNGADVKVLVPRNSDVFFMPWVATAYYSTVLKNGGRIYEYLPRMLHAKTTIVDHWMTVGSSNFNRRSLVHDFEVDLVVSHHETHQQLISAFVKDLAQAEEVRVARGGLTSWVGRLLSMILKNWI